MADVRRCRCRSPGLSVSIPSAVGEAAELGLMHPMIRKGIEYGLFQSPLRWGRRRNPCLCNRLLGKVLQTQIRKPLFLFSISIFPTASDSHGICRNLFSDKAIRILETSPRFKGLEGVHLSGRVPARLSKSEADQPPPTAEWMNPSLSAWIRPRKRNGGPGDSQVWSPFALNPHVFSVCLRRTTTVSTECSPLR